MKKTRSFYFLLSIVLLALLPSSIFAYRTNMGTINIEVGQEVKVYAEKYSTASGNWSKTGNCFYISAKSQTSCKIYGLQAGTAELKWVGVIGATDYDMYWTINVTDPNSGGNGGDSGNSGGSSEGGNSDNTTSENWTTNGNYDISWYDKSKKEFSISTAKELAGFAYIVNNGYDSFAGKTIILSSNIDLSGKNWQTVGIQSSFVGGSNYFKGTFDGQNYIISGLNITKHNTNQIYYGFFGYVYGGAIIDLELRGTMNIDNSDCTSSSKKSNYVGSLLGYAESCNIENCKSRVTVNYSRNVQNDAEIKDIYVGGLAGYYEPGRNTSMTKSAFYGNISCKQLPTSAGYYMTGTSYVGGLVGKYVSIYGTKLKYCESDVNISVEHPYATKACVTPQVAGLIAYASSGIRFCRTICSININHHGFPNYDMTSGMEFNSAGICANKSATIENCYAIVKDVTVSNNRSDWKLIYYGIGGSESSNRSVYSNSDVTINTSLPISKELMGDTYTSDMMKTSDFLNELNTYSKLELGEEVWMLKNNPSKEREQYPSLVALNANSNISVTNIDIEDSSVTLGIGETKQLKATVSPENATNKSVSWSSDNTNVATVGSNTGLVTAIGDGTATITCKANDGSGVTATCTVTVINPNAIDITSTNFPDANFRNWLLEQYYGQDGKLTESEIKNVTSISVNGKNISTLKGVEFFTSLNYLNCSNNQLITLDLSKNTSLTQLYCYSNQLTSLDVSKNTALTVLCCYYNQLTSLDVSKNTALTELQCGANQLTSLDVSNTVLTSFNCHINQINGKAMDTLISSLPYNFSDKTYEFRVISPFHDDEGNVCTKSQVAAAKAKGWTPLSYNGTEWVEYEGSDEYQYAKGDVNMDNTVNGTDLVALSNIVLGRKDKTETADVNGDGSVNGTDIVALSNIILGRNNNARSRAPETGASLSIEPFDIKAGETKELLIDLTNPNDEMTLVQFDLHLPVGLSIKKNGSDLDFDMAGRTSWRKHTLDANEVDDAYRFLLYSSGNTLIEGTNGAIIKVNIVADETFNGGKIVLDNILLVDPNEKETKPEAYEYVIPTPDEGSAKLSVEPFDIAKGETKEMQIDLSNPNDEVTLVQFDLHLPTGLSIKKSGSDLDFDMGGRTSWRKHTLDANEIDGAYRFLLYSSGNTLIEGTSGAIIKMSVVADESFNGGKIVLDNILLVDPNEKEMKPARCEYEIGSGSGISSVKIDTIGKSAHIYNLSGQKLSAPKKGINIIGGKKVVVK